MSGACSCCLLLADTCGAATSSHAIAFESHIMGPRWSSHILRREAKDKNRESWYMAYIMDTNEEERAKGKTVEVRQ